MTSNKTEKKKKKKQLEKMVYQLEKLSQCFDSL